MRSNYDDVLAQLHAEGLTVDALEIGRLVRCRVEGDRERRGWYSLHELVTSSGDTIIVGSFGVWRGGDNGARKVELRKIEISNEQREMLKRRLAEDRRRADIARKGEAKRAAERATRAWAQCSENGESEYLVAKAVGAHGVRFSPSGALAIPMLDTTGQIHGLQIIRSRAIAQAQRAPVKQYWPQGASTKGHFHLIGSPQWIVLIAEGYATGASLYEATNYPVAIAFDSNNLAPVAAALRKRYRNVQIVLCADDDVLRKCRHKDCGARFVLVPGAEQLCPKCGREHGQSNVGVVAASTAAVETGGAFAVPQFADPATRMSGFLERGTKVTDFNDLHVLEGLHVVRAQIEQRISELGLRARQFYSAVSNDSGGEGEQVSRPIGTADELLRRFWLIEGQGSTVFDNVRHRLMSISDMRDLCVNKYIFDTWKTSFERQHYQIEQVGFDPSEDDSNVKCNLWSGWPTRPRAGSCEKLLELLRHMCSAESQPEKLFQWVMRWIAYPIQHPGAKMKTTVVVHGEQGTGKNMFFEAVMAIYGRYGRIIDQGAIEDKFNDWASRRLFLIADEVVARSDVYHIKNKLKAFITGEWIRINPKNIAAYDERNHVNVVFLSNEFLPLVLEEDDRRHTVIWTPKKLDRTFYAAVKHEIAEGGIEALHDHLLNLDLGDFDEATSPFQTEAKNELINQSLDSTTRFYYAMLTGDAPLHCGPALTQDVYDAYKFWCARVGERNAPLKRLVGALERRHGIPVLRKRWEVDACTRGPNSVVMFLSTVPDGEYEPAWIGNSVTTFRDRLKEYRGMSPD